MAMQVLFEVDTAGHEAGSTVDRVLAEGAMSEVGKAQVRELVEGVSKNRDRLDEIIHQHAPTWPVDQLSAVDRNILRIAIFEILFNNKTPSKAAINEAVELAKLFGSESIHRFINGVLGSIMGAINTEQQTPFPGR